MKKMSLVVVAMLAAVVSMFSASAMADGEKEYNVFQLSLNQGVGWCVETDAPAGKVVMNVGKGKDDFTFGNYKLAEVDGLRYFCSDYFAYDQAWEEKFPVRLVYNLGTAEAKEVILNGFRK